MIKVLIALFMISSIDVYAITFDEAVKALETHESIASVKFKSKAVSEEADLKGSWGDPMFKVAAKNFPQDSLKDNETPL